MEGHSQPRAGQLCRAEDPVHNLARVEVVPLPDSVPDFLWQFTIQVLSNSRLSLKTKS